MRGLLEQGALVQFRPDVSIAVSLYWHQWKLAPDGMARSPRVATLDRIGAALEAGARAALGETQAARGRRKISGARSRAAMSR